MHKDKGQLFIGGVLVVAGLLLLLGKVLQVNLWGILWPVALIGVGVWLVLRPRLVHEGTVVRQRLFGDIDRRGAWEVSDEEIWMFAGDIDLDMSQAEFPLGETRIRCYGFAADVKVRVPEEVGVKVSANNFAGDVKLFGEKHGGFLSPVNITSANYESAETKLLLETSYFASDVKVQRSGS